MTSFSILRIVLAEAAGAYSKDVKTSILKDVFSSIASRRSLRCHGQRHHNASHLDFSGCQLKSFEVHGGTLTEKRSRVASPPQ